MPRIKIVKIFKIILNNYNASYIDFNFFNASYINFNSKLINNNKFKSRIKINLLFNKNGVTSNVKFFAQTKKILKTYYQVILVYFY